MMMNFPSVGKTKMAVAKEVIKRVNDMVPELGYQGACTPSLLMARS